MNRTFQIFKAQIKCNTHLLWNLWKGHSQLTGYDINGKIHHIAAVSGSFPNLTVHRAFLNLPPENDETLFWKRKHLPH